MRKTVLTALLVTGLAAAAPALAKSQGFDTSITSRLSTPVKIEVVLSEDMAYRADHLPKELRDRSGARSLNAGFAGNGYYGQRDLEDLTQYLEGKLASRLEKAGATVSDNATTVLRVTLEDAKPNRPTFNQLGKQPNLSFNSFGNGGATMKAELIGQGGESLGSMSYSYFESSIRDAQYGSTWKDAKYSMRKFSKKAAKTLVN